ncbi:MAG TPA: hypothetical protein VF066_09730 [Thermoleophilaceae bacterium]
MISIELITGEPVVVTGDDIDVVARQIFEADGPAAFTTTAGVHVLINPAHVVRISHGNGNAGRF